MWNEKGNSHLQQPILPSLFSIGAIGLTLAGALIWQSEFAYALDYVSSYVDGLLRWWYVALVAFLTAFVIWPGFRIIMATGDNERTAKAVAGKLGIDEIRADVLPEDKASIIRELQSQGRKVAMAGDGVNDAPALAQADVGIAMGTGADVAIESAGFTLVKGNLDGIVRARRLSQATMRNIKQNLFFALVYNGAGVPVAAGVLYPFFGILIGPIFAAFAMSASSLSVVMNSLRLRREKV